MPVFRSCRNTSLASSDVIRRQVSRFFISSTFDYTVFFCVHRPLNAPAGREAVGAAKKSYFNRDVSGHLLLTYRRVLKYKEGKKCWQ